MNAYQNRDIIVQFDMITRKLKETGKDLGKIRITNQNGAKPSYITKRIMSELEGGK